MPSFFANLDKLLEFSVEMIYSVLQHVDFRHRLVWHHKNLWLMMLKVKQRILENVVRTENFSQSNNKLTETEIFTTTFSHLTIFRETFSDHEDLFSWAQMLPCIKNDWKNYFLLLTFTNHRLILIKHSEICYPLLRIFVWVEWNEHLLFNIW